MEGLNMKKVESCPVTHVSLHVLLRDLLARGVLGTEETYRPGIGRGARYTLNGEPLQFKMGFVGRLDWLDTHTDAPVVLSTPHDVAYVGNSLVTMARSL
jgi:hypothetical protein